MIEGTKKQQTYKLIIGSIDVNVARYVLVLPMAVNTVSLIFEVLPVHVNAAITKVMCLIEDADFVKRLRSTYTLVLSMHLKYVVMIISHLSTATLVYCDNVSAVYMSANPVQHQRTKHIEIDIHFVRDMVTAGQVRVLHVPSRFQYADIFTKGLPSALFEEFLSSLSVRPPPAPTAGAY
ncbi:ribonuclease H-like domain-containing protein [Tanacetum coccineum]